MMTLSSSVGSQILMTSLQISAAYSGSVPVKLSGEYSNVILPSPFFFASSLYFLQSSAPNFAISVIWNKWYAPFIEAGKALFPTSAQGTPSFRPEEPITREDTVYALVNALGFTNGIAANESLLNDFTDQSSISQNIRKHFAIALRTISDAKAQVDALSEEVQALTMANETLSDEIAHASDKDLIMDIARSELGLVEPGEKVFYDQNY